ncbi:MAG: hypothetical protein II922_11710 [Succinimonas sp.]|nr:hypothetical protein [Succinimonas sp.]
MYPRLVKEEIAVNHCNIIGTDPKKVKKIIKKSSRIQKPSGESAVAPDTVCHPQSAFFLRQKKNGGNRLSGRPYLLKKKSIMQLILVAF